MGAPTTQGFPAAEDSDPAQAFGPILGRMLGADCRVIAYEGSGVLESAIPDVPTTAKLWRQTVAGQDLPPHNPASWVPQVGHSCQFQKGGVDPPPPPPRGGGFMHSLWLLEVLALRDRELQCFMSGCRDSRKGSSCLVVQAGFIMYTVVDSYALGLVHEKQAAHVEAVP